MGHIGWFLYQAAMASGLALAAPYLLARRGRHYLTTLPGRLGLEGGSARREATAGGLWIHAVSVGEVGVAATLAQALPEVLPLVITTVTPTGQERARALFGQGALATRPTQVAYLPFDLGFAVDAFYRRFRPAALVLVEGDYWPLVLHAAERRSLDIAVVNGRVGAKTSRRLQRFPRLGGRLFFSRVRAFGVQTDEDRQRLIAAGAVAERVEVTGNLKYDTPEPAPQPDIEARIRKLAGGRPILIAGSTMAGEDDKVLDAFQGLGGRRALLILVPRHPERWDPAAVLVRERGLALARRSELAVEVGATSAAASDNTASDNTPDVLLLDSLGELAALYRLADVAFIGGTLVPTGGHNPLEPAHFAVPTVVGPSMENFAEMATEFERAGAWRQVADPDGLTAAWGAWLDAPEQARRVGERARELLRANRGAVARTLELLQPILASIPAIRRTS